MQNFRFLLSDKVLPGSDKVFTAVHDNNHYIVSWVDNNGYIDSRTYNPKWIEEYIASGEWIAID
jgi:hypothetical protein